MAGDPIPMSAIDDALLLEDERVPWNSQLDVSAPRLEPERVRAAYNAALAHHDLGTCRLLPDGRGGCHWVPADGPVDIGPVAVVECADDAAVDAVRCRQLDARLPLDVAPLARVTIARRAEDDLLLSCVSHVLTDGLGLLRLLQSVGRSYRGVDDPPPAVDVRTAQRRLGAPLPTDMPSLVQRWVQGVSDIAAAAVPRSRVAPSGGDGTAASGVVTRAVDGRVVSAARAGRGTSFDDYAVAAAHLAIDRWNRARGEPAGRIGVSLGVNLRAFEWYFDVVANLAAFASSTTDPPHRGDLDSILAVLGSQLTPTTRLQRAQLVAEATRVARLVPRATRGQFVAQLDPDRFDSLAISNGGVIADPPRFADGYVPDTWVTQPAIPSVGLAMALHTVAGELRITVRYRRERFDAAGAGAFVDAYVAALTGS